MSIKFWKTVCIVLAIFAAYLNVINLKYGLLNDHLQAELSKCIGLKERRR